MIGVQDEKNFKSALKRRIGAIFELGRAEQHVQKIPAVAQFIVWIYEWHSQAVPVGEGCERGHLSDQAIGLLAARFGIEDVLGVRVEGRKGGDGRYQHAHRMSIVVETVEKF